MSERRPRSSLAELMLVVALCGLVLAFVRRLGRFDWTAFLLFYGAVIAWSIAWKKVRANRLSRPCPGCGLPFVPTGRRIETAVCPLCRQRSLSPVQSRRQRTKGLLTALALMILLWVVCFGFVGTWIVPLIALGVTVCYLAVGVFALQMFAKLRFRMARNEKYALSVARKKAGGQGSVTRLGPITVWSWAPADPTAMLEDQVETSRSRFSSLVGEPAEIRHPLRFLCFGSRPAFVAYYRHFFLDVGYLDGVYIPAPARTATLSVNALDYRLTDPERIARTLSAYYFLESHQGRLPSLWLQHGISNAVAQGGGDEERSRLNRKVLVSLSRPTALDAPGLFHVRTKAVAKLARGWYEHRNFVKMAQFNAQSRSLVEYLCGVGATEERRGPFRSFLRDRLAGDSAEDVFERHFGYRYDALLQGWRDWVSEQGVGTHGPPPPPVRAFLVERLVPLIVDRQAKIMDRIEAIRSLGQWGYALGADTLIGLLRTEPAILKEDVVWSLEAISGLPWGDDPDRWAEWWSSLPPEAVGGADLPELPRKEQPATAQGHRGLLSDG